MILLIFAVLLAVAFLLQLYFLRSTGTEKALRRQLADIADPRPYEGQESTILKEDRLSQIPWMHDFLLKIPQSSALVNLVKQSGEAWWVSSLVFSSILLGIGGGLLAAAWTDSAALIVLGAFVAGMLPVAYLLLLRERKLQACGALLPEAVELMARALRAGHALTSAIEMVSQDIAEPLATEFRIVFEEQSFGLPLRDALTNLLRRIPRNDIRFLTTALLLQKETGGNLVQILDTTSILMRQRVRTRNQIKIYTAQARATAWVVGLLPFIMFGLMSFYDPDYEKVLLTDPTGIRIFFVGVGMLVIGVLMIRKIVSIKV